MRGAIVPRCRNHRGRLRRRLSAPFPQPLTLPREQACECQNELSEGIGRVIDNSIGHSISPEPPMNDPPATQPHNGSIGPAEAAALEDDPDFAAVIAGFDPDLHGLDPAALEHLTEPSRDDLCRHHPGDDGDDGAAWLAALATDPGAAFTEAAPLDILTPGGALAGCTGHALDGGLGALSDDALVGLLRACRRIEAWQSGIELAAVAELDRRRLQESRRPGWSRVSETIAAELAVALVLTGRSADS